MSILSELANFGIHLGEDVSDDIAKKLLEKVKETNQNGSFGKIIQKFGTENPDYGKVIRKIGPENSDYGKVLFADKPSTTLTEMNQARDQVNAIKKDSDWLKAQEKARSGDNTQLRNEVEEARVQAETMRKEGFNANVPASPEPKRKSLKDMMSELNRIKEDGNVQDIAKKSAAGVLVGNQTPIEVSPLPYLKKGYEAYKGLKDKIFGAAANQMDLTKDKSATEGIKMGLDLAADPLNYIPGGVGMALGGLQTGLEMLPNEENLEKRNKFQKVKELMNRKPTGDLP